MEIVARILIGILQNIFQSWSIFFSQSPKVVFWTNCALPLNSNAKLYYTLSMIKLYFLFSEVKLKLHDKLKLPILYFNIRDVLKQ